MRRTDDGSHIFLSGVPGSCRRSVPEPVAVHEMQSQKNRRAAAGAAPGRRPQAAVRLRTALPRCASRADGVLEPRRETGLRLAGDLGERLLALAAPFRRTWSRFRAAATRAWSGPCALTVAWICSSAELHEVAGQFVLELCIALDVARRTVSLSPVAGPKARLAKSRVSPVVVLAAMVVILVNWSDGGLRFMARIVAAFFALQQSQVTTRLHSIATKACF